MKRPTAGIEAAVIGSELNKLKTYVFESFNTRLVAACGLSATERLRNRVKANIKILQSNTWSNTSCFKVSAQHEIRG